MPHAPTTTSRQCYGHPWGIVDTISRFVFNVLFLVLLAALLAWLLMPSAYGRKPRWAST